MLDEAIGAAVLCGDVKESCVCFKAIHGPAEDHVCRCDGSWAADGSVVRLPQGRTLEDFFSGNWGIPGLFPDPIRVGDDDA